jgi:BMFP domain-containing protein YqiC
MLYPPDFIERCKAAFPDWTQLHDKLDAGQHIVGRYLGDTLHGSSVNDSIAKLVEREDWEELKRLAARWRITRRLYDQWVELYEARLEQEQADERQSAIITPHPGELY